MSRNGYDSYETLIIPILPDEVILDNILPRVPAKSLVRFKCVCKDWLHALSTPEFAKSKLEFSSLCPKLLLFGCDDVDDDLQEGIPMRFESYHIRYFTFTIVGSCNGLMCLNFVQEPRYFLICNPVTQQYRYLTRPTLNEELDTISYGLGYVKSTDDYKIVVLCSKKDASYDDTTTYHVYSSPASNWKLIDKLGSHVAIPYLGAHPGALIGDTLYWTGLNSDGAPCVISFGLIDDQVKEIPWPNYPYAYAKIFGVNGCLTLFCRKWDRKECDVWVFKAKHGRTNKSASWEKVSSFKCKRHNAVVGVTQTGKFLVFSSKVKLYDPNLKTWKLVGFYYSDKILGETSTYVESLVSPFGLSPIVKNQQMKAETLFDLVRLYSFDLDQ